MTPAELRALIEKASLLPWEVDSQGRVENSMDALTCDCVGRKDSALIVAAVNALPSLLDRIEALEAMLCESERVGDVSVSGLAERHAAKPNKETL